MSDYTLKSGCTSKSILETGKNPGFFQPCLGLDQLFSAPGQPVSLCREGCQALQHLLRGLGQVSIDRLLLSMLPIPLGKLGQSTGEFLPAALQESAILGQLSVQLTDAMLARVTLDFQAAQLRLDADQGFS